MIRLVPLRLLLAVAYMGMVFALSSIPGSEFRQLGLASNLVSGLHVPLFAGLAWVVFSSLRGVRPLRWLAVAVVCMAFAFSDEWHQSFVHGRYFSYGDILLDAIGVALGLLAGELFGTGLGSRTGTTEG